MSCTTVEALLSGRPREAKKVSVTGVGRLRECKTGAPNDGLLLNTLKTLFRVLLDI